MNFQNRLMIGYVVFFFLPAELLQTNIERFGECMETKEGYLKYKALGSYLHKYVSTNYIFYYKKMIP